MVGQSPLVAPWRVLQLLTWRSHQYDPQDDARGPASSRMEPYQLYRLYWGPGWRHFWEPALSASLTSELPRLHRTKGYLPMDVGSPEAP
ncbi:rCG32325 [Rattus norvegicus]|uniref:RCG32325 n=1 Tax=Rattus norvegicus TaxID=10116 RepID=A6JXN1_RAT|nr:rCG32325 [Rattus norvegicus]